MAKKTLRVGLATASSPLISSQRSRYELTACQKKDGRSRQGFVPHHSRSARSSI